MFETESSCDKGFIMIDSNQELSQSVHFRIGLINDLLSKQISNEELKELCQSIQNEEKGYWQNALYLKYLGVFTKNQEREKGVREQMFCQYIEQLTNNDIAKRYSYGVFAPSYFSLLLRYQEQHGEDYPCQSLLAGALTINSFQEFLAVNHSVFPKSENIAIDINIDGLYNSPDCFEINALNTSYPNNHFDTIQTNSLITKLINSKSAEIRQSDERQEYPFLFLKEAFRILKDGGLLIMVDSGFNTQEEVNLFTHEYLLTVGFSEVKSGYSKVFKDIKNLTKLTRCSHGNFNSLNEAETKENQSAIITFARK